VFISVEEKGKRTVSKVCVWSFEKGEWFSFYLLKGRENGSVEDPSVVRSSA